MTTAIEIKNELENRGYIAQITDVTKNSVHLTGLTIRQDPDQRIAPNVYLSEDILSLSPSEAADLIEHRVASSKAIDFGDPTELVSRENIITNVVIGLQRTSNQPIIKRASSLDRIDQFLFIRGNSGDDGNWSIKVTQSILDNANLSESEVWTAAEKNTFRDSEITIESMQSILANMLGSEDDQPLTADMPMYVISNRKKINGAVQIFNRNAIRSWASDRGYKRLVMLPSSLHEVIVVPADGFDTRLEDLSIMVQEVNATQVDPVDQLGDHAYIIDLSA